VTHRFLAYPLLLLAALQLAPLLRQHPRWHAVQIAQLALVVLGALAAVFLPGGQWWLLAAATVFIVTGLAPRLLSRAAAACRQRAQWSRAAQFERAAGRLLGGGPGRLRRGFALALDQVAAGDTEAAQRQLTALETAALPRAARALVRYWRLALHVQCREWLAAVAVFRATPDWGTTGLAAQARLEVARALAELGDLPGALRCVQLVLLSPGGVRLETPLWAMRVRLAAMAGHGSELERLLADRHRQQRGFARFTAYWRGRCALAGGDRATASRLLARAYALTDPRDRAWQRAIQHYLHRAGEPTPREVASAATPPAELAPAWEAVRWADEQSRPWRDLLGFHGPTPAVAVLLAEIAAVFLAQVVLPVEWSDRLLLWGGNGAVTWQRGEWWRLVTAMFLHGGWLHVGLNGVALWMFGAAVERVWGWWRMLTVFLLGGAAGNLLSAAAQRVDLAVGASAGVFALVGAFAVTVWRLRSPWFAALRSRLLPLLAGLVAVDFLIGWREPVVDNLAHVGGFAAGVALAVWLCPRRASSIVAAG
jgi:membrane associated rhomboid family serine protease